MRYSVNHFMEAMSEQRTTMATHTTPRQWSEYYDDVGIMCAMFVFSMYM